MTSYQVVYDAFLAQISDDEWANWEDWERQEDWKQLLYAATPWFKFPRIPLTLSDDGFVETIDPNKDNNEIQVIVAYMKFIWLSRIIDDTKNLQTLYSERDFSPAQMLKEFKGKQDTQLKFAKMLESTYYRSIGGKPYPFSNLAGG